MQGIIVLPPAAIGWPTSRSRTNRFALHRHFHSHICTEARMSYSRGRGGRGGSSEGRRETESVEPSSLVHVSDLPEHTLEADMMRLFGRFGGIKEVCMLPHRSQALIEFDSVETAKAVVEHARSESFNLASRRIKINFSTSQHIVHKTEGLSGTVENKVLLFTVFKAQYPITVEVLHQICSPHGTVCRIVIFRKYNLQAMVEFARVDDAAKAKRNLNGADIYSGCCTIKVEFAVPQSLTVIKNDQETWDYENPQLGNASLLGHPECREQPSLLKEPRPSRDPPHHQLQHQQPQMQPTQDYGYGGAYHHHHQQQQPAQPSLYPTQSSELYHQRHPHPAHLLAPAVGAPPTAGSVVLMVYGLNPEIFNCQRLFNLLCLYGNVVRVKFLRSMEGSAMVQMGEPQALERAMQNMNFARLFGHKLQLSHSKQAMLVEVAHPHNLPDGSPSFMDFSFSRNNRFTSAELAAKNKMYPPFRTLHFWNCPPHYSDDELRQVFVRSGGQPPEKIHRFPHTKGSEKTCAGLVQWERDGEAAEALVLTNNFEIESPGHQFPFAIRLSFAVKTIGDSSWSASRDRSPFKDDGANNRGGSGNGRAFRGGRGGRGGGHGDAF